MRKKNLLRDAAIAMVLNFIFLTGIPFPSACNSDKTDVATEKKISSADSTQTKNQEHYQSNRIGLEKQLPSER